jgi:nucleoid-associated protein YgaU
MVLYVLVLLTLWWLTMFKTIKRFAASTISLALASAMFLSLPASAQNLAEAARQERERRKTLAATHHVYTNEDLTKPRILVPEDQARAEAHNTSQSSLVLMVAIDASQSSSPLPIPGVTLASQAPVVSRRSVTVPAPPNSIYTAATSFDVIATSPARLLFPAAETSAPKIPERRGGIELQAPAILSRVEYAQIGAPGVLAVPMVFPDAETSAPKAPERRAGTGPQAPSILLRVENTQFGASSLLAVPTVFPVAQTSAPRVPERRAGVEPQAPSILSRIANAQVGASSLLAVPMVFPDVVTSAPKVPDRRAAREPQAPFILSRAENAQIRATAHDVLPFPAFLAVPTAVPNEPLAAEHSSVTPPAIRSANCVGPCSELHGLELNGILSTQYVVPVSRPAAEASSIQPAIVAKSESINPRPAPTDRPATQVRVQIGDSLWKLAKRYLGDGNHWRVLAALNRRLLNPGLIRPGELIQLPAKVSEEARQVVVQPGDTLWTVAETALGSPLAFNCIAQANPQLQSADVIHPGQTLWVPETCSAARQLAGKDHAGAL